MSYHIYKTTGVILKEKESGEAGKVFSFFTEDFGRVEVAARGVRYLKSKLRYALSGLAFLRLGFVGTASENWRLVDAEETGVFVNILREPAKARVALRILSLLERLIRGQETDRQLWKTLGEALIFLEKSQLKDEDLKNFEILTTLKLLAHLGYAEVAEQLNNLSADEISVRRHFWVALVKKALAESQL